MAYASEDHHAQSSANPAPQLRAPMLRLVGVVAILLASLASRARLLIWATVTGNIAARHRALGEVVANAAEALGPVFTKAAQMVSYRHDILPEAFLAALARLQDQVKPLKPGEALRSAEAALGRPAEQVFSSFDEIPVACGSIAVVCRAVSRRGEPVAVKIVRPGVAARIERDLACLRWVMAIAARSRFGRGIPVLETFEMIAVMIADQSDMQAEGRNLSAFRAMLAEQPAIWLPAADPATTTDMLVMEFAENAIPLLQAKLANAAFRRAADGILHALYVMIFKHGLVHCDMHPGNLLIRPDGCVVLIDAGLVARLSDEDRSCFAEFFLSLATNDRRGCARAILRSAVRIPRGVDLIGFQCDVDKLVEAYHGRTARNFLIAEFVYRVFEIQRRHGLFAAPGFAAAIWALIMFEGLVRARIPDLDFQAAARPFVAAVTRAGSVDRPGADAPQGAS